MAKKNWIAGAIRHPGALHRQLGVPLGKKIPATKLASAASKGGVLGRRARLAQTLRGFQSGGVVHASHASRNVLKCSGPKMGAPY
jgi:hypothetical protein